MVFLTFGGMISRGMRRACRERSRRNRKIQKKTGSTVRCWHFAYLFHHLLFLSKKSKEEDSWFSSTHFSRREEEEEMVECRRNLKNDDPNKCDTKLRGRKRNKKGRIFIRDAIRLLSSRKRTRRQNKKKVVQDARGDDPPSKTEEE